jgi:hypothetical protein
MYIRMDRHRVSVGSRPSSTGEAKSRPFDDLERLNEEKLVLELHPSFVSSNGDMVRSSLNRFNAIILAWLVMFHWYTVFLSLMPGVTICFENSRVDPFLSSAINLWSHTGVDALSPVTRMPRELWPWVSGQEHHRLNIHEMPTAPRFHNLPSQFLVLCGIFCAILEARAYGLGFVDYFDMQGVELCMGSTCPWARRLGP